MYVQMNIKFIFATLLVLFCYVDVETHARTNQWKRRDLQGCQKQVDALSVLMKKEVSRLDVKDSQLMLADETLKDKTRQVDRKYQMEVDRLNNKDEDLMKTDVALMNKDQNLDEKDGILEARQWTLVQEVKMVKEWVHMAEVKLEEAHEKIDELKENNSQITAKLEEAHEKISELKENNTQTNVKLEEAHDKIMELQNKTKIKAAFDGSVVDFTFSTGVVNSYTENTDDGSFFDETLGCFTAPCTGTYRFTVDALTTNDMPNNVQVVMTIDDVEQGDTFLTPDLSQFASCTVVRVVEEGQKVDVVSRTAGSVGNLRFSGHLINCQH